MGWIAGRLRGRAGTQLDRPGDSSDKSDLSYLRDCAKPKLIIQGGNDQFGSTREHRSALRDVHEPKRLVIVRRRGPFFSGEAERSGRGHRCMAGRKRTVIPAARRPKRCGSKTLRNSSRAAGSRPTSARFSSTCPTWLMPTSAVVIPGADRANCKASAESFFMFPSAAHVRRQISRELPLQKRRTGHQRDAQGPARLHHGHRLSLRPT